MFEYSIVATSFNDEQSIMRYLENMKEQTLHPAEIVIADGGSSDNTVLLIKEFARNCKIPIICLCEGRLNISEGYNCAIKHSNTDYIGISGIGNIYAKDYYELLYKKLRDNNLDLTYSPIRGLDANAFSKEYNNVILNGAKGQTLQIASNHGALAKKKIFDDLGYFYEKFNYAGEDAEFYSLVKENRYSTSVVDEANVYWETPTNWKQFLKQIKVYTIAELQINSKKQWKFLCTRIIKLGIILCIALFYIVFILLKVDIIYKTITTGVVIALLIWKRKRLNVIQLTRTYLPIYFTIKNRKYMEEKYAVKRENR